MEQHSLAKSSSPYKNRYSHGSRFKGSGFNLVQTVEHDFSKKKNLKNTGSKWKLPRPNEVFTSGHWEMEFMMNEKNKLNHKKNELSNFNMKDWHVHTKKNNHAGDVVYTVRKKIYPELLTQAWCKFYEIASSYNLVPSVAVESGVLNSLHLCEAPGAFITSLNHFLKLRHSNIKWKWLGNSLNPYHEGNKLSFMINDDRLILHTLDSWEFGLDQTGDVFKPENMDKLISSSRQMSPVLLVTADGSIDCQSNPGEQERIVFPLHYCETLVALNVLSEGGSFLLKMFTMFESQTINLLYLLSCVFEFVEFFKPATSKEGNSEVYVICLNFKGPAAVEPYLDVLGTNFITPSDKAMFSQEQLSIEFICNIRECARYFRTHQVSILDRNIQTFTTEHSDEDEKKLNKIRRKLAYSYIERYCLDPLSLPDDYLVGNDIIRNTMTLNLDPRNEEWTYTHTKTSDIKETLLPLKIQLESNSFKWAACEEVIWFESEQLFKNSSWEVAMIFGKPVMTVYSSKFCLGSLLHTWNKLCELKVVHLNGVDSSINICDKLSDLVPELKDGCFQLCDMRQDQFQENVLLFEKLLLKKLLEILKETKNGGNLVILGVPLLTRFSVGLIYLTSHIFEKMCFVNPESMGYVLLFLNKKDTSIYTPIIPIFEHLHETTSSTDSSQALLSIVHVLQLVKDVDWYKCILTTNHVRLWTMSSQLINDLLSDHSTQED